MLVRPIVRAAGNPYQSKPFGIRAGEPAVVLAPMEGVTDHPMRALFSEIGGFDHCVSEFLRVNDLVPPAHVIYRHIPELRNGGKTPSQIPVQVQLLGGNAERLAQTAATIASLGAPGIDLNFGCPAPTVNRHDGGATLLKYPLRIREIVEAVRKAVPSHLPVSAKLRLGWEDTKPILENADRAAEGGASWITIHARTRAQGYALPVYWGPIGEVRRRLKIPVIANGEINTLEDLKNCQEVTGCEHFMLGRGAFADPLLALKAQAFLKGLSTVDPKPRHSGRQWQGWLTRFEQIAAVDFDKPEYRARRMKQWAHMAQKKQAIDWFDLIKRYPLPAEILSAVPV